MTDLPDPNHPPTDEPPDNHPPTDQPPPADSFSPTPPRRFRRGDGYLGGVAVGLAHLTGLDLTLVRIILVVGSVFAPVLIPLYLAAWVLVPTTADPDPRPYRITSRTSAIVVGVFLLFAAISSIGDSFSPVIAPGNGTGFLLAAALVAGGVFLLNQREAGLITSPPPPPAPGSNTSTTWAMPLTNTAPLSDTAGQAFADEPAPPVPSPPLTSLALGTALLVSCVLLALSQAFDWGLGAGTVLGVIALCCGLGLVVSAFVGRAIPLVFIGLTALALQVAAPAFDTVATGSVGTIREAPATMAELDSHYEISAGELILDLRPLLSGATTRRVPIEIDVGAGYAEIIVPPDAAVVIDATSRFGYVEVLGETREGMGVELSRRIDPIDVAGEAGSSFSEGEQTVVIDAAVTFGYVEVRRG